MAIVSDEQVIKVLRQYNTWWRNTIEVQMRASHRSVWLIMRH